MTSPATRWSLVLLLSFAPGCVDLAPVDTAALSDGSALLSTKERERLEELALSLRTWPEELVVYTELPKATRREQARAKAERSAAAVVTAADERSARYVTEWRKKYASRPLKKPPRLVLVADHHKNEIDAANFQKLADRSKDEIYLLTEGLIGWQKGGEVKFETGTRITFPDGTRALGLECVGYVEIANAHWVIEQLREEKTAEDGVKWLFELLAAESAVSYRVALTSDTARTESLRSLVQIALRDGTDAGMTARKALDKGAPAIAEWIEVAVGLRDALVVQHGAALPLGDEIAAALARHLEKPASLRRERVLLQFLDFESRTLQWSQLVHTTYREVAENGRDVYVLAGAAHIPVLRKNLEALFAGAGMTVEVEYRAHHLAALEKIQERREKLVTLLLADFAE